MSKRERARKGGLAGGSGRSGISLVDTAATKQGQPRQRELAAQLGVPSRSVATGRRYIATESSPVLPPPLVPESSPFGKFLDLRQNRSPLPMSAAPNAGICVTSGSMAGIDRRNVYRRRRWRYRSKHGCVHGWTDRCGSPCMYTPRVKWANPNRLLQRKTDPWSYYVSTAGARPQKRSKSPSASGPSAIQMPP